MPIPRTPPKMFETRSQAWKEVGLIRQISPKVVRRARLELLVLLPLSAAIVFVYDNRVRWFGRGAHLDSAHHLPPAQKHLEQGVETPITVVTVVLLVILGWAIARDIGRGLGPALFRRLDPATAGTVGFLIRLATIVLALIVALQVAGIEAKTLALGGAFTAGVFGPAAPPTPGQPHPRTGVLGPPPVRVRARRRPPGRGPASP